MDQKKKNFYWKICYLLAALVAMASFTPLVIPYGQFKPMLLGMPYTLWMGFMIYLLLVLLTWAGTLVYPDQGQPEEED
jgi:hypothetical protein